MTVEQVLSNLEFIREHSEPSYDYPCSTLTTMSHIFWFNDTIDEAIKLIGTIKKVQDHPHCTEYMIPFSKNNEKE